MKIGDVIKVSVTDVQDDGAYVVSGDQQAGFIDWYEFSWIEYRCDPRMPRDVLAIGQMIDVKVYGFQSNEYFAASIKRLNKDADPWLKMTQEQVGEKFDGEILSVGDWGLIVRHPFNIPVSCPYPKDQPKTNYRTGDSISVLIEKVDDTKGVLGKID